ncbi:MAG: UvrD-helicase domain-containing protein [Nitrospiraceae bacterium]|nr:UvrD-helicase domain-containing protein [Nitrospiraceae bacterium]
MSTDSLDSEKISVDFQQELNPEQLKAVEILDGPVLVIAGAGSGKTRTLVYRVARLIQEGIDPGSILLLTFTRKASATMLGRVSQITGPRCQAVAGGTFHGFANRMLRRYGHLIGYPSNFTILDRGDAQDLLHLLAHQLGLAGQGKRFPKKSVLASIVGKVENSGESMTCVLEQKFPQLLREASGLEGLMSTYCQYKKLHALMDYDDLLLRWRDVLKECREVREAVGARFRYIMVDEYQDTNATQAEILRLMACGHDNVMVVGDDAQSIYSFRGANFKNILNFPEAFPGTKTIKLERNYRTTQPNLDCTNAIIANARDIFTKRLVAQRKGGNPPYLYVARDEMDQAKFVADRIEGLLNTGLRLPEIAVLFRAGFHSFHLEAELNRRGINFIKRGGIRLLEAAHIKDLLSLLRILVNPIDRLSWSRILLLIERLGPKGVEEIFSRLIQSEDPLECLASYTTKAAWGETVRGLGKLLKRVQDMPMDLPALLLQLEDWYRPHLKRIYHEDYPKRLQELAHLREIAGRYTDAVTMLSDLALDPPNQDEVEGQKGSLVLSTMHSAKGLEWRAVLILSLAEGRFPSSIASHHSKEIEEERRLFYVAATRAKDYLYFCYPTFISISGTMLPARPSRFLEEIPANLLRPWKRKADIAEMGRQKTSLHRVNASRPRPDTDSKGQTKQGVFRIGERVRHPIFGPGQVIKIVGPKKVRVSFDVAGEKTLHLDYANLSVVSA